LSGRAGPPKLDGPSYPQNGVRVTEQHVWQEGMNNPVTSRQLGRRREYFLPNPQQRTRA